jgi:hypothetical protein
VRERPQRQQALAFGAHELVERRLDLVERQHALRQVDTRRHRLDAVDEEAVVLAAHRRFAAKHVVPALRLGHRQRQQALP